MALPELPWVDWVLIALLVVSIVVGLWRGFVFEAMSVVGWLVAWFGAQWLAPQLAPYLPVGEPGAALRLASAYVLAFVGLLVAWALLARLVRLLVHATPLGVVDRVLGSGFGFVRGGVLLLALATLVALSPAQRSPAWQASTGARWLEAALAGVKPLLPPEWARHLPA